MTMLSIFSIPIEPLDLKTFSGTIRNRLHASQQSQIVTLNPEILLEARGNEQFHKLLCASSYRVVDGFGISLLTALRFGRRISRITGMDVVRTLCAVAEQENLRVGCIGGGLGVAKAAAESLAKMFPKIDIQAIGADTFMSVGADGQIAKEVELHVVRELQDKKIAILLVGLGAPKQEFFMTAIQKEIPSIRVVTGIGGLLDVLAGIMPKPPSFLQRVGLEWLWRLLVQPSRIVRIFNAIIVFPVFGFLNSKMYDS